MNAKTLTKLDLQKELTEELTTQDYSKKPIIDGVKIVELKTFTGEDGYFLELARLTENSKIQDLNDFQVRQVSYSLIEPGGVKAWHIHLNQEDVWFAPPDSQLLVGLYDLRNDSPSKGAQMRLTLGNHKSLLLLIPRGVAHGCANISTLPTTMIYFTNQHFDINKPDEFRLPWDNFGEAFWKMTKG